MPVSKSAATRVIAVEEHFLTERYISETASLAEGPGEAAEKAFIGGFGKNPEMSRRTTDLATRLAEMDASGTDLAVLSLNPPGVQLYADAARATALAHEMNDALVEIVQAHPTRFAGLGSIAPHEPDAAAQEVKRIMGPLGLGGVMINSHTLGYYVTLR